MTGTCEGAVNFGIHFSLLEIRDASHYTVAMMDHGWDYEQAGGLYVEKLVSASAPALS
jgi:hypothetical protein